MISGIEYIFWGAESKSDVSKQNFLTKHWENVKTSSDL